MFLHYLTAKDLPLKLFMYIRMWYIHVHVDTHECTHKQVYVHMYVRMYKYLYVCTYVRMHACTIDQRTFGVKNFIKPSLL